MTSGVEKIENVLLEAREKLQQADRRVRELDTTLRDYDDQQSRVEVLSRLQKALRELRGVGGSDPFSGDALKKNSYEEALVRIQRESDEHRKSVGKLKDELKKARAQVIQAIQDYDQLRAKFEAEEKKTRRQALEAYRREVREKGFQARKGDVFYRSMSLPWGGSTEEDRRLRRVSTLVLLFSLLLGIGIGTLVLPEVETKEVELPARMAMLLQERQKKLQPVEVPQEQKIDKKDLAARKKAPEPKTRKQQRARDRAKQSGLLALSDTFESLKQNAFEDKLGKQANIATAGRQASNLQRSIVTARAETGSGGIVTSSLSRGTGGSTLSGRSTSRVSSGLADSLAASADRRIIGSGKASRTDEEIQIVFDRNKSALYRLYNRALRKDPTLQGKIVLKLTIAPSGQVTMCKVISSSLKAPVLERKIAQRVKLFNFGRKKVNAVTITYPIDFLPA